MAQNAGLLRRFGAMLYDSILVAAVLLFISAIWLIARGGEPVEPYTLPHQGTLLIAIYAFFVGFWTRSGSTLGMLAWRLRVEDEDGKSPTLARATTRFFAAALSWAALGLGFLWQLWDRDRLTWHDRLSGTRLRYYPKLGA